MKVKGIEENSKKDWKMGLCVGFAEDAQAQVVRPHRTEMVIHFPAYHDSIQTQVSSTAKSPRKNLEARDPPSHSLPLLPKAYNNLTNGLTPRSTPFLRSSLTRSSIL